MNDDCKTCKHFTLDRGNSLCNRVRTFADLRTRDTPIFIVLERDDDAWVNVNRRIEGDVCGPEGKHHEPI